MSGHWTQPTATCRCGRRCPLFTARSPWREACHRLPLPRVRHGEWWPMRMHALGMALAIATAAWVVLKSRRRL